MDTPSARVGEPINTASVGAVLVLVCYIGSQFVDVTLTSVGGFVFSVQKLVAIAILPLGALMMRKLRFSGGLAAFSLTAVVAFGVGPVLGGHDSTALGGALTALVLNFAAGLVVYSALLDCPRPVHLVGRIWIAASLLTAIIAIGQTFSLLPLFTVPEDDLGRRATTAGLQRATGLKADPNFAAMILIIGLVFARLMTSRAWRRVVSLLMVVGIFSTLSRMGVLVAAIIILVSSGRGRSVNRHTIQGLFVQVGVAVSLCLVGFVGVQTLSGPVRAYVDTRLSDLGDGIAQLVSADSSLGGTEGSAVERADLFQGTVAVLKDNLAVGVGPGNLPGILDEMIGVNKGAHNTYLESLAIGGAFGAFALAVYIGLLRKGLRKAARVAAMVDEFEAVFCVRMLCLSVGLMAFVLTLDYNAFLWLPITIACGLGDAGPSAHIAVGVAVPRVVLPAGGAIAGSEVAAPLGVGGRG